MEKETGLKREIGVWGLSANIVNIIVGAGIFVLPAIVAEIMGSSGIFVYLFCGFLIALVMLCFAEAGSKVTRSGGAYAYVETAFGPYTGFLAAVFMVMGSAFSDAAVANALIELIGLAFPVFTNQYIRILLLFLIFGGLCFLNVIGVKQGIGLVKINTVAKLTPLILLIFFSWKDVSLSNLMIENAPFFKNFGAASLILFFAFQGGDAGLTVGGEIKNPQKTVPKAIFIGISFVLILYILIQTVSQGVLGDQLPEFKEAPLASVANVVFGPTGYTLLLITAGVSMFGMLSGEILNLPRVIFGLASDRVIPLDKLAAIHPKFKTPYLSILLYAGIGFTLASVGGFRQLAVIASASMLLVYFGVSLSVIKLRKMEKTDSGSFKIPFGYTVPILSAGIILFFLSNLTGYEKTGILIFILALTLIYFLVNLLPKSKR
ncbi:APC family permease [Algoriphagus antarcticus]|uniref:Amino acid/polyamine/organocation transporter (APC superfamily) n=1 Tax=Algoriphagus antarcticus TaxID=238540 RepID=A0A3E0DS21_9BACT|nr:amino acid permease [Algoriphagus antarcticus]REG86349.1 amino acid/polyamine/organocation transporter (APC superfamily) [Algoriphagus antarcticus]